MAALSAFNAPGLSRPFSLSSARKPLNSPLEMSAAVAALPPELRLSSCSAGDGSLLKGLFLT
jgi:hypothetical protein